jgi:2-polyprenyl-6-methoxyphenol hydroxylase-like FAD-dependent oxidoreductase
MSERRAVVIGGSMAGLVAARVLSEHFDEVTLVERDRLVDSVEPRKGVPQGRHLHGLLKRGEDLLSQLFPDLVPALLKGGAVPVEFGRDMFWHHFGAWKARTEVGVVATFLSRGFLEAEVRRRVLALPRVKLVDNCDALGFAADAERRRVTGAILKRFDGAAEETLSADLVVDASGRGSRTPKWLEAMGRPAVAESQVKVDVGYATRIFKRPPEGALPWKAMYILGQSPESRRLGAVAPIEGNRWLAIMAGLLGDHPPSDATGWMEFARSLPAPDLHTALKDAEPEGDIATYKFPAHQRRHYERMNAFPDGLAVLGDSHCSFNPIYGQGMTTAIIGAVLLGEQLARRPKGAALTGLSREYQRALAKATDEPWAMSTGEDFRYPEVAGDRPFGNGAMQWFTGRVHRRAATDPEIALRFYRAMHMIGPVTDLMKPGMLMRILA